MTTQLCAYSSKKNVGDSKVVNRTPGTVSICSTLSPSPRTTRRSAKRIMELLRERTGDPVFIEFEVPRPSAAPNRAADVFISGMSPAARIKLGNRTDAARGGFHWQQSVLQTRGTTASDMSPILVDWEPGVR